ncbi:hypothetical protein FRX31_026525 [Thalictrum thalictroides]|uniref:Uncharacterized protein n=1 Tax=Thalictrum thalictroides TaxID=46969 RepID=A0A7J6VGZ7_THATH|nr:hypothetical protein FRX31_026525 [Thalictrum thalictroides]
MLIMPLTPMKTAPTHLRLLQILKPQFLPHKMNGRISTHQLQAPFAVVGTKAGATLAAFKQKHCRLGNSVLWETDALARNDNKQSQGGQNTANHEPNLAGSHNSELVWGCIKVLRD